MASHSVRYVHTDRAAVVGSTYLHDRPDKDDCTVHLHLCKFSIERDFVRDSAIETAGVVTLTTYDAPGVSTFQDRVYVTDACLQGPISPYDHNFLKLWTRIISRDNTTMGDSH